MSFLGSLVKGVAKIAGAAVGFAAGGPAGAIGGFKLASTAVNAFRATSTVLTTTPPMPEPPPYIPDPEPVYIAPRPPAYLMPAPSLSIVGAGPVNTYAPPAVKAARAIAKRPGVRKAAKKAAKKKPAKRKTKLKFGSAAYRKKYLGH